MFLLTIWIITTFLIILTLVFAAKYLGDKILIGAYAGMVAISTVTATKLISIFGVNAPAGTVVFAASFLMTDILADRFGRKSAYLAVLSGVITFLAYAVYSQVTVYWDPAPYWDNQESYENIVGMSWRIALGGVVAFFFSQMWDVTIFHYLKEKQGESNLAAAIRNNASTVSSQILDSAIFVTIAFTGIFPIADLFVGLVLAKIIIALIDTPFFLLARYLLRERPKSDVPPNSSVGGNERD